MSTQHTKPPTRNFARFETAAMLIRPVSILDEYEQEIAALTAPREPVSLSEITGSLSTLSTTVLLQITHADQAFLGLTPQTNTSHALRSRLPCSITEQKPNSTEQKSKKIISLSGGVRVLLGRKTTRPDQFTESPLFWRDDLMERPAIDFTDALLELFASTDAVLSHTIVGKRFLPAIGRRSQERIALEKQERHESLRRHFLGKRFGENSSTITILAATTKCSFV